MKTALVQSFFILRCLDGRLGGALHIDKEKTLVGTKEGLDLILADSSVSPLHAFFFVQGEGLLVKDLCSEEGIFLQGRRVEECYVYPGDTLTIGTLSFALEAGSVSKTIQQDSSKIDDRPLFFSLPTKEGLVFIDGEYCDIVFNDTVIRSGATASSFEVSDDFIDLDCIDTPLEIVHSTIGKKLEIISYLNGLMMEVTYLDLNDGDYFLSPGKSSPFDITFNSIKRQKIFSIKHGELQFFESELLTPSSPWNVLNLKEPFFLSSGVEQVSFRLVEKTMEWRGIPALYRDRDFLSVGPKAFFSVFLPLLFLLFIGLPEKPEESKEIAVVYKLPEKSTISEAQKKSELRKEEVTSHVENTGHKATNQKNNKVEYASASATKRIETKAESSSASSLSSTVSPVKAYEFQSSVEVSSIVGDAPELNTKGSTARGTGADSSFKTGSRDSGELVAGADIGVSKFNGSDKKGNGSASYGSRGLATKSGFDSSYLEPKTVVLGSMDPELLRKILREYIPQFRHCYQQELVGHSDKIKGIIDLNFTISSGGKVSKFQVQAKDAQFSAKGVGCMGQVLSLIEFPRPKGGGVVDVKQPLNFFSETEKI
jgi:hypothetical protein